VLLLIASPAAWRFPKSIAATIDVYDQDLCTCKERVNERDDPLMPNMTWPSPVPHAWERDAPLMLTVMRPALSSSKVTFCMRSCHTL